MKSALALFAAIGLLLSGVATADPSDCGRLMQQIKYYEGMADRAEALGKDDWAGRTQQHVEMLETRLDTRCPAYAARDDDQKVARRIALALKFVADAATTFFTLGAF
jgi:hypothetical protein